MLFIYSSTLCLPISKILYIYLVIMFPKDYTFVVMHYSKGVLSTCLEQYSLGKVSFNQGVLG